MNNESIYIIKPDAHIGKKGALIYVDNTEGKLFGLNDTSMHTYFTQDWLEENFEKLE